MKPAPASGSLPATDPATGETIIVPGAHAPLIGGEPLAPPPAAGLGGAPRVDLDRLDLSGRTPTPIPAGASPERAEAVAEAAGHAVPKATRDLADEIELAGGDDEDLTRDEIAILRAFLRGLTGDEVGILRRHLRDGFPGERLVTAAQAREIKGHLGGSSLY